MPNYYEQCREDNQLLYKYEEECPLDHLSSLEIIIEEPFEVPIRLQNKEDVESDNIEPKEVVIVDHLGPRYQHGNGFDD